MKNKLWTGIWGALSACLALTTVACLQAGDGGEAEDDARIGSAEEAFTTHAANACTSHCSGGMPDGACSPDENEFNCAQDCSCGDGACDGSETPASCPLDCWLGSDPNSNVDDFCGNGRCEPWEYGALGISCVQDCKLAPDGAGTTCGDASCDPGETTATCPADCGNKASCGNGACEPAFGENHASCESDCTSSYLPPDRFLGASCSDYALHATYSDGNGGTTEHVVTTLAAGCNDAYPWKVVSNAGTCNGSTLLRPDGTTCTIQNANCANVNVVAFTPGTKYLMAQDPKTCGFAMTSWGFQPLEWSKADAVTCSAGAPCAVYSCTGTSNYKYSGQAFNWKPQVAPWSVYAPHCQ